MSNNFVHLRLHSEFSIGAGTIKVKKIPELCAANGMTAVAQTDNNLMCGAAQMSDVCARAGIQPIIGITATLNHHESADAKQLRSNMMSQIVLLAQNQTGYLNLSRLNSEMYLRRDNMHLGPHITLDELAKYSDGVICLSGAHTGPIGFAILENQLTLAREFAARLSGIFPNRFYMELQRHGLPNQIKCEPEFLSIARDMNLPIVATNDVCFDRPDSFEAADAYSCILGQSKIIDPDRPKKSSQQYFKSADEMTECFNDLPEAIENTGEIAKRCAFMVNVNMPPLLPRFGDDFDAECKLLRDNVDTGLTKRLADIPESEHAKYRDQAAFECDVIIGMKFPGYFLIVADYIDWCRKNDILVGPGRGSGAGSVVAWSLGITNVNPMAYGLLFERFLNPDRVSMPDFDVDFEPDGIARILEYVREKYGAENVCRIITFGTLQARGTIRDVGRVYGVPYSKTDRFAKLIPMDAKNLSAAVENTRDIREAMEFDADLDRVVNKSMEIEGLPRNLGQHACGVVIGDRAIAEISPLYRDPGNELPSCQYDGHYLERTGLIKFDFLGLETLAILKYAIQMIQKNHGHFIDLDKIPMDDEKTMELWRRGLTVGVFQYEAPFVRQTLLKMQPTSFANIVALNALNRPGPIAHIPSYIDRMQGRETVKYPHAAAEEILKETYGIIVYQEQVMALSRALAGFTRGESDTLRKGMGKKIVKVMEEMRVKFIDGCEKQNTLNREAAEDLYQQFMKFAEYAFNKSHSVCYSVIAMQCAYIKAHYPAEFLAASMSSELNDSDQLMLYIEDARANFKIEIMPPDVNKSESLFSVQNGKIVFGLAAIKGVGKTATDAIISERDENGKFKNLTDFVKRTAGIINKRVLEAFAKTGALDSLALDRAKLYMNADKILAYGAGARDAGTGLSLFDSATDDDVATDRLAMQLSATPAWTFAQKLENEMSALGFYISAHPLDQYRGLIERAGLTTSKTLQKMGDRRSVQIAVAVNSFSKRTTKTGKQMCSVAAADSFGNVDAVAFGFTADDVAADLNGKTLVLISGKTSVRDDSVSIFIDSVTPLENWVATVAKKLILDINDASALPAVRDLIGGLRSGNTKIEININGTTLALPGAFTLSPNIVADFGALGVRAEIK